MYNLQVGLLGMPSKKPQKYWTLSQKGGRVQTGSQIFHIVQMGHRGVGGPDGNVPNAAHTILFKGRLITNILFNVAARYLFC